MVITILVWYLPKISLLVCMELDLEKYEMPIERGLPSKIYYSAYQEPKSGYKISFEIHGKHHHRINTKINELKDEGYFKPVSIDGCKHPKWVSCVEPLISMIQFYKKQENVKFTELEKYILKKLLDSEAFRKYVSNPEELKNVRGDFNSVYYILEKLDCLAIEYLSSKAICEIGTIIENIKNEDQYDNFIKESLKSSSMNDLIDVISDVKEYHKEVIKKPIPKWFENKKVLEELYQNFNNLKYCIYVPKSLMEKIIGVTELGQMEPVFKALFSEAQEMDSFANYLSNKEKENKT